MSFGNVCRSVPSGTLIQGNFNPCRLQAACEDVWVEAALKVVAVALVTTVTWRQEEMHLLPIHVLITVPANLNRQWYTSGCCEILTGDTFHHRWHGHPPWRPEALSTTSGAVGLPLVRAWITGLPLGELQTNSKYQCQSEDSLRGILSSNHESRTSTAGWVAFYEGFHIRLFGRPTSSSAADMSFRR